MIEHGDTTRLHFRRTIAPLKQGLLMYPPSLFGRVRQFQEITSEASELNNIQLTAHDLIIGRQQNDNKGDVCMDFEEVGNRFPADCLITDNNRRQFEGLEEALYLHSHQITVAIKDEQG